MILCLFEIRGKEKYSSLGERFDGDVFSEEKVRFKIESEGLKFEGDRGLGEEE